MKFVVIVRRDCGACWPDAGGFSAADCPKQSFGRLHGFG